MPTPYTHKKLEDVKDSAPEFGLDEGMEARFAKNDLDAEQTGVSHHRLEPANGSRSATSTRTPRRSTW